MTRKYFGTDGVRGPYGGPVINENFASRLGYAVATWLRRKTNLGPGKPLAVLIGRDTRFSGAALETAMVRGLHSGGAQPVSLGVLPTPAVSRAVREQGADLGVVITASHNPADDNGIKFFGPSGLKLTDDQELEIESILPGAAITASVPFAASDGIQAYIAATSQLLPKQALAGWRIVLDTANGATCVTSPQVLRTLGAEVIGIGDAPDGRNINAGVGSEHPDKLADLVRTRQARIGIAHDGDGDRCVLCDERGEVLDGDEILAILALHALKEGRLRNNTLVVTVQSNLGVDAAVSAAGGRVVRTAVGDRYVIERMLAVGAVLGGESSGHVVCSEISPTGDGLVAALKIVEVMAATGKPLSELRQVLKKYPQLTAALKVREKKPIDALPKLRATMADLERELGAQGRVLVRWSGTETKLRLLVEGPTQASVQAGIDRLTAAAKAELTFV